MAALGLHEGYRAFCEYAARPCAIRPARSASSSIIDILRMRRPTKTRRTRSAASCAASLGDKIDLAAGRRIFNYAKSIAPLEITIAPSQPRRPSLAQAHRSTLKSSRMATASPTAEQTCMEYIAALDSQARAMYDLELPPAIASVYVRRRTRVCLRHSLVFGSVPTHHLLRFVPPLFEPQNERGARVQA